MSERQGVEVRLENLVRRYGGVTALDGKIEIFQVDIEIGQDQLVLNQLPYDACHFIAVDLDDRIFNLDFCHKYLPRRCTIA